MLREKKDELSRLLLSRKRKLCELYYATVSLADLRTTVDNPQYKEKERLFLDANDLQKGRFFDISTLPPRAPITRSSKLETPLPTSHHTPLAIYTSSQHSLETATPSPNRAPSPKSSANPAARLASPAPFQGDRDIKDHGGNEGGKNVVLDVIATGTGSHVDNISPTPEERIQLKVTANGSCEHTGGQQECMEELPASASDNPQVAEPARELRLSSSTEQANVGAPEKEQGPLVLAAVPTTGDPQSSPASTNGVGSSHTPDAAAGSPTTSPGDEQGPEELGSIGAGSSREANSDTSKLTYPNPISRLRSKLPDAAATMRPPADTGLDPAPQPQTTSVPGNVDSCSAASNTPRKPNMRIDTQVATTSGSGPKETTQLSESPMSLGSAFTPLRVPSSAPFSLAHSPPGRITRISSGTIRHRSVSEILGEAPKPPSPAVDKSSPQSFVPTPVREAFAASALSARLADRKEREKDRSRLSTVVFAKPKRAVDSADPTEVLRKVSGDIAPLPSEERDYLHILFESKACLPPRGQSLNTLLQSAHKTLSTADHLIDYQEQMNCRTLKRIYQLQNANRWPLRQLQRALEPVRQTSHWDFLLDHAKWIRTDFREERKWKIAAARGVAEWCAEWVASSPRRRQQLQVKLRRSQPAPNVVIGRDVRVEDRFEGSTSPVQQTPGLVPATEIESISDGFVDDVMDVRLSVVPAAIFSLGSSEFNFPMSRTPAMDKLLSELPYYEPARIEPDLSQSDLAERSDSRWKTDIIPISRFATEEIRYRPPKAPSRRSRYDYEEEDFSSKDMKPLPPEQTNVALFMPENKHIRDRIHPGHSFKPPTEYPMPAQAFFESRPSSQWTQAEDDELRKLVKDYSYNWSLISSCLSTKSPFHAGADRRTPWECFERWINLEGLPAEMSKMPYFRAYHSRIEAAGKHVIAQQEATESQAGANPGLTPRKRTSQPIRVERKKNQRHLAMLDAMRKLAKKRETALQKQQHAADMAAMRKANEVDRPRPPFTTPADFSRLKYERELKFAERQEIYRLQLLAREKAAMQQRTAQMSQANVLPNGNARSSIATGLAGVPTSNMPNMPNSLLSAVGPSHQARPQPGIQRLPGGVPSHGAFSTTMMGPKGLTQAQAGLAAGRGLGHSPEHMRVFYEANRLQQQQQLMLAARQQQQQGPNGATGQHSSPSMPNGGVAGANGSSNGPAFLAALATSNGAPSPSMAGGHVNGVSSAGSPRLPNGHSLSTSLIPAISQLAASIQRQNPEMSPDEIQRLATSQLNMYRQHAAQNVTQKSMNQAALNAAAGAANASAHAANANPYGRQQGMMTNEQVQAYNLQLREQQAAQRATGGFGGTSLSAGLALNMNGNVGSLGGMTAFTGSPVLNMSRPVSNHAGQGQLSRSATPREQRASSSGGMAQSSPRGG